MAFSGRESKDFINMAHSLQIHCFEIPFGKCEYMDDCLNSNEVFSVHASKNMLEKDEEAFMAEATELKTFCEKCNCKRIVFHPNPATGQNESYFTLLENIFFDYVICIENTNKDLDELMQLLSGHQFRITWDSAHAAFHDHYIGDKMEMVEYFHIRGFSEKKRYVSLVESEKKDVVPKKGEAVYIMEYPYSNMYELLMDWKYLREILIS